jgi:Mg2+ and Co2+ transporter CorA
MGFLFKKTHQLGVIVGALVGFLVLFLIVPPWPAKWGMDMGLFPKLAWPWFSPIACIATMITGILVSALVPRKTLQAK